MIEHDVEKLILYALQKRISDIYIMPQKENYAIFFRYNGEMQFIYSVDSQKGIRMITYFKYISGVDIGEKRKPQSGACHYILRQKRIELRTSLMSNFELKESLVIRLLKLPNERLNLNAYFQSQLEKIYKLFQVRQGLIIFAGPIDSGKTTTIHYLLQRKYNEKQLNIITLEDPVECVNENFLQLEINDEANINYASLIKASLRHAPDILVIGEIRDEETAKMVIRASLTGHLVVATVHAKSCLGVIERLKDLGISNEQLIESITSIISQRLLPRYCALCQKSCQFHCMHIKASEKRLPLFQIMSQNDLNLYWLKQKYDKNQFNHLLNKAYGLGYISQNVMEAYYVIS